MPNPDKLRIEYYPARRDIIFKVFENDIEIEVDREKFNKYSVEQEGKFVLSLQGNDFFDDILRPFAGKDNVNISIKTTRIDYEDFKNRVKKYNLDNNKTRINLNDLESEDELLEMREAFSLIKEQGEKIVTLLDDHYNCIKNIEANGESKSYLLNNAEKIEKIKTSIQEKVKSLSEDNNVNLCLVGSYSSGKSTLINTLLEYKIVPVDIRESTAKMIIIKGVKDLCDSYIKFSITDSDSKSTKQCSVKWDNTKKILFVEESNIAREVQNKIQEMIEANKTLQIYEQIYNFLNYINEMENLDSEIKLGFPISIDSKDIQYTIYDTPGTDSNYVNHRDILKEALNNQNNSILIFVLTPDSISGSGNKELMKYLLENYTNENTMIDIEQSFFVINKADTNTQLEVLKTSVLHRFEGDTNPIDLSEKKLFFIASNCGFAVKSKMNKIPVEDSIKWEFKKSLDFKYFQYNHYGKSEYATEKLLNESTDALKKEKDELMQYYICSGFYSLEAAIKEYGDRYAFTTKTSALFKSIEKAVYSVTDLEKRTSIGEPSDEAELNNKEKKLEAEKKKVKENLEETKNIYTNRLKKTSSKLEVGLDSNSFVDNLINPIEDTLKKKISHDGIGKFLPVRIDEQIRKDINDTISEIYSKFTNDYKEKREKYLSSINNDFVDTFMEKISEKISEETKKHLMLDKKLLELPAFELSKEIEEFFDNAKLWNNQLIKSLKKVLAQILREKDNNANLDSSKSIISSKNPQNKIRNIIDKVKKTPKTVNKNIEEPSTKIDSGEIKTISPKKFINSVTEWLNKNQTNIIQKFENDLSSAVNNLCDDLSKKFIDNIDTYSSKIRALNDDIDSLKKLFEDIKKLNKKMTEHMDIIKSKC